MTPADLRALAANATPGPWHPTELRLTTRDKPYPSVAGYPYGRENGSAVITTMEPAYKGQPAEADARLIALAPDLAVLLADAVEALDELRRTLVISRQHSATAPSIVRADEILARFRALEAKETGT